jgi:class 3 adenylate cyclase
MTLATGIDLDSLTLAELLALREHISEVLVRRFERPQAIAFTDVVGSTAYFAQFGDEAGRGLQQRHLDLLVESLRRGGAGRIVDTAGDGALTCFPSVGAAVFALIELQHLIAAQNASRAPEHHLAVRCGVHWGPVLTDGTLVTGDAVNLCARVTATAQTREVRLTRPAMLELPRTFQTRCRALPPAHLKGIPRPIEMVVLEWRERAVPTAVSVSETGQRFALPDKPTITFGRLREHEGLIANDIVLWVPDKDQLMRISRWHFELRRHGDELHLHPVSSQTTEVDGRPVDKGQHVPVVAGTVVRLADAVTLTFLAEPVTGEIELPPAIAGLAGKTLG